MRRKNQKYNSQAEISNCKRFHEIGKKLKQLAVAYRLNKSDDSNQFAGYIN